jgi:hypothetical protein
MCNRRRSIAGTTTVPRLPTRVCTTITDSNPNSDIP